MANIRPISNRVVLKKLEKELTTKSGLILSRKAEEGEPSQYEVVAAGKGLYVDGVLQPMEVKAGDKVFVDKYAGNAVKLDGEEYLIVLESEILGIIE